MNDQKILTYGVIYNTKHSSVAMNMGVQVGDIFRSSWGYDQTNIDFYQVVSRTQKMLTVRMIRKERVGEPHCLASYVMPKKDCFLDTDHAYDKRYGAPMKRRILVDYTGEVFFNVECGIAKKWNGLKQTETYTG